MICSRAIDEKSESDPSHRYCFLLFSLCSYYLIMKCPRCKNLETRVIDSRLSEDGLSIRRRRECESCQARFTTFERMEFVSFFVTKTGGKKELYNRSKLETSILKACNKRNLPPEKIESMLNTLEIEWAENKT